MAKELPYFKFHIGEWLNGDITLEDFCVQGLFINICAYYWSKDCNVPMIVLRKKFRGYDSDIDQLLSAGILKEKDGIAVVSFLDEQMQTKEVRAIINRKNGKSGGRPKGTKNPKKTQTVSETKPNDNPNKTNIEESIVKKSKKEEMEERKLKFSSTLTPFLNLYGRDMMNDFYKYWTEPNKSGTKFKQEMEKTWDTARRLEKWASNNFGSKQKQTADSNSYIPGN